MIAAQQHPGQQAGGAASASANGNGVDSSVGRYSSPVNNTNGNGNVDVNAGRYNSSLNNANGNVDGNPGRYSSPVANANGDGNAGRYQQTQPRFAPLPTQPPLHNPNGQFQQLHHYPQIHFTQQRFPPVGGDFKTELHGQNDAWQVKFEGDGMRYGGMGAGYQQGMAPSMLPPLKGHPTQFQAQPQPQHMQQQHGMEKGMFMNGMQASTNDPFIGDRSNFHPNTVALPPPPPGAAIAYPLSPFTFSRPTSSTSSPSITSYHPPRDPTFYQQQPYFQSHQDPTLHMDISSPLTEPD
ncbi:hypothetical protein HK097_005211, partial [Rhizophlyctis rosea]